MTRIQISIDTSRRPWWAWTLVGLWVLWEVAVTVAAVRFALGG